MTRALIKNVEVDSPAYEAGFTRGCYITSINGEPLRDIIDWRWHACEDNVSLGYIDTDGDEGVVELERLDEQDWGIEFDDVIFDEVKLCKNACKFCFMAQLPKGMRGSLSLRDDDFRLSFLTGTFVTLTNLEDDEIKRIIEQRISPLRVSLHAISDDVRRSLIGKNHARGIQALEALLEGGIEFDAQIVLCPSINDGDELVNTLEWAYAQQGIKTVGIVPLGFTSHQSRFCKSFDEAADAKAVIDAITPYQRRSIAERDCCWVHAADEFYRNAFPDDLDANLPDASMYGDFSMFEDGIGIIRSSIDELKEAYTTPDAQRLSVSLRESDTHLHLIAGKAMSPYAAQILDESAMGTTMDLLFVKNTFFGGNVNVTGLLTGADITRAIIAHKKMYASDDTEAAKSSHIYLLPDVIFNVDDVTLDGMSAKQISTDSGADVLIVPSNPLDCIHRLISQF
ncbi:MAG: DUF512 domain-containing protein [Eggerthellaceae bacterium]|nr:DUF512 domain-containing protein [Eggerthellaceae bacterium]